MAKMVTALVSSRRLTTKYHDMIAQHTKVLSDFRLDWLKVIPHNSGKYGGWVGENFVAHARIAWWLTDALEFLLESSQPIETPDPVGHPTTWTHQPGGS